MLLPLPTREFFTGTDGQSHFEDLDLLSPDMERSIEQAASSITFTRSPNGRFSDWHNAPRRQYAIFLSGGQMEVVIGDGTTRRFGPGDTVLFEDLTGQGHTSRSVGGNILLMGIVEEAEGVQNIRDILRQVSGIGAIWAGPGDMSVSMGLRGQASHPDVQENLLRVLAACKEFGVPCATGATADDVAMRLEQGFRIIMTAPVRSTPGLVEGRRLAAR